MDGRAAMPCIRAARHTRASLVLPVMWSLVCVCLL
jgi:hypothetical protein